MSVDRHEHACNPDGGGNLTWLVWPTVVLLLLGAAYRFWITERGLNPDIHTFGDAIYLAFITVTTVGYGDLRPRAVDELTSALRTAGVGGAAADPKAPDGSESTAPV